MKNRKDNNENCVGKITKERGRERRKKKEGGRKEEKKGGRKEEKEGGVRR